MSALRVVESIHDKKPIDLEIAQCALDLAGLWLGEKDRKMRPSLKVLHGQATEEFEKSGMRNRLLFDCMLLAGCVLRAIDTEEHFCERWTDAARAVAKAVLADAEQRVSGVEP